MKTYHIKDLLKKELLILELPENVKIYQDECDEGNHIGYSLTRFGQDSVEPFGLINGYTLLGKPNEIKEEDAMELVETDEISDVEDYRYQIVFIDYKDEENAFSTATESLLSAIDSVIFWENPYKI